MADVPVVRTHSVREEVVAAGVTGVDLSAPVGVLVCRGCGGRWSRYIDRELLERQPCGTRGDDCWWIPKWSGRQYESDNTTDRTRKHRSKAVPGNDENGTLERSNDDGMGVVGTPPETETETDVKPPLPPPSGGAESQHHGQHPNCRACSTNLSLWGAA